MLFAHMYTLPTLSYLRKHLCAIAQMNNIFWLCHVLKKRMWLWCQYFVFINLMFPRKLLGFFFHAYFIRVIHLKIAYIISSWWYDICWKCNCLGWIHFFGLILHSTGGGTLPPLVRINGYLNVLTSTGMYKNVHQIDQSDQIEYSDVWHCDRFGFLNYIKIPYKRVTIIDMYAFGIR